MLSLVKKAFTRTPGLPSALLAIGEFGENMHIIHMRPEDGELEQTTIYPFPTTFRLGGAKEQSREKIGTVTLFAGPGDADERLMSFTDDLATRIRSKYTSGLTLTQLVQDILRPEALDAIQQREKRSPLKPTETYPVYIVHVIRSKERIVTFQPTSIHRM